MNENTKKKKLKVFYTALELYNRFLDTCFDENYD